MNSHHAEISFPTRPVELKMKRARPAQFELTDPAAADEVPVHTISPFGETNSDLEALRICEANLRAYEERLREWQDQLEQAHSQQQALPRRSANPWAVRANATEPARQDAWQKVLRARELLEVEQKHLRDDRITLQGLDQQLKEREAKLAAREAHVSQREQQIAQVEAADAAKAKPAKKSPRSSLMSITRSPFSIAKSVFGA
ncbi:MAG: hypothetical protein IPN11_00470 [Opitutaceae bacterium]|nr:hypothetical protein [Opitutaceae bacterium]